MEQHQLSASAFAEKIGNNDRSRIYFLDVINLARSFSEN